jgi:hypothetical protein
MFNNISSNILEHNLYSQGAEGVLTLQRRSTYIAHQQFKAHVTVQCT